MKILHKQFTSKVSLYQALEKVCPALDIKEMIAFLTKGNAKRYFIFTKSGETFVALNTKHFFAIINKISGSEFLYPRCFNRGPNIINVFSRFDYFGVESPAVTASVSTVEEKVEAEVSLATIEEEVTVEDTDARITHAKSLYNEDEKSRSKITLENYARGFDIELNRGKKFSNMITELEEALKAQG